MRQVRYVVNIYETEGGKLNALQDFEEGCWVKVTAATMWEMEPVAKKYNIDLEDMRAALDEEEKSRIVLEDDYTLVLVDIPASEIQHEKKVYTTIPLGLILADGAIITICSEDTPILNTFIKSHVRYFSTKKRTRFVYQILLNSMTTYQNVLRSVDNRRLAIEARIGEEKEDEADLVELHDLESTLVYFETSLRAAGMVIDRLRRYKHIPQFPEDEDLLEDVQVENRQAIEMATIYREIIDGTSELMSNVINNRLNNTMKYLTSITLVMAVPTIISGLYGMNVNTGGMPFGSLKMGFGIICGLTFLLCLFILWILWRKRML